jgi:hypothetical protein
VALNVRQPISLDGGVNQNNLVNTRMATLSPIPRPRASQLPAGAPAHIRSRPHVVAAAASGAVRRRRSASAIKARMTYEGWTSYKSVANA